MSDIYDSHLTSNETLQMTQKQFLIKLKDHNKIKNLSSYIESKEKTDIKDQSSQIKSKEKIEIENQSSQTDENSETNSMQRDDIIDYINILSLIMINYLYDNRKDVVFMYKSVDQPVPEYLMSDESEGLNLKNGLNLNNLFGFGIIANKFSDQYQLTDPELFSKYTQLVIDYYPFSKRLATELRELNVIMNKLNKD